MQLSLLLWRTVRSIKQVPYPASLLQRSNNWSRKKNPKPKVKKHSAELKKKKKLSEDPLLLAVHTLKIYISKCWRNPLKYNLTTFIPWSSNRVLVVLCQKFWDLWAPCPFCAASTDTSILTNLANCIILWSLNVSYFSLHAIICCAWLCPVIWYLCFTQGWVCTCVCALYWRCNLLERLCFSNDIFSYILD